MDQLEGFPELKAKISNVDNKDKVDENFVLKFKQNEEYLYGDYLIGSYDFVKGLVRQHEKIYFYLKKLPCDIIQPPLMNFPPIILQKGKKYDYFTLLKTYLEYYPECGIIYRLFKTDEEQKKRFLRNKMQRTEALIKFTESGDCYFPFYINILGINNVYSLKEWFEDKEYNKNEMMLPNFTYYPQKDKQKKKKKKCCFFFGKSTLSKNELAEEKLSKKENEAKMKMMSSMAKKNAKDDELQEKLNRLKIKTEKDEYYNYGMNSLTRFNVFFGDKVSNSIAHLNTSADEDSIDTDNEGNEKEEQINLSLNINPKFKSFKLEHFTLPIIPTFIRLKISLLYGSYSFLSFKTKPLIISNNIIINERIFFDKKCLISNLPFETRIGLTLEAFDKAIKKSIVLGSCQVPLYQSNGQMQSGLLTVNLWPNVKTLPRINNCYSFNSDKNTNILLDNKELLPPGSYPEEAKDYLPDIMSKMEPDFKEILKIYKEDLEKKAKLENMEEMIKKILDESGEKNPNSNLKTGNLNFKGNKSQSDLSKHETEKIEKDEYNNTKKEEGNDEKIKNNPENKKMIELKDLSHQENESNITYSDIEEDNTINEPYCSIQLKFPSFGAPLIYSQNCSQSYRNYLEIKYRNQFSRGGDDFEEIRKLYGNSQQDIGPLVDNFQGNDLISEETFLNNNSYEKPVNYQENKDKYPRKIWDYIQKTLPLMIQILKKDPMEALEEEEIVAILICRDYISTIPSALELFLRAIDWLNPLQVSIAHLYIKKWAKLEVEDAISLLDARFPDTETREFAVSMLRDLPDDLINMYMLQLCQSLLYETFLINPLSDFLIERSLINPKLIGISFFWNSRVNMKNPLFAERLSAYLIQILMVSGEKYLKDCFNGLYLNDYLEFMTYYVKITSLKKKEKPEKCVSTCLAFFEEKLKMKNFTFPIDPTYFGVSFTKDRKFKVFGSKMLPILLFFNARENDDTKNVIFKIGDDLRQDVLTLQIFKIMDKLWLDNNLDLKLLPYKVCPTELKAGFIECLKGTELDKLQMIQGMAGALNRELIVKFLRGQNTKNTEPSEQESKYDNFIKSLAGYCVATCVIGVGDRHPGNIMLKDNGIFFHIDFGHILGNFKSKFFIKRERSLFLLTPEMANVYVTENKEEYFKTSCVKAFNILRHNAQRLINMFIIMSTAGMPELCGMNDVKYVKKMLVLDKASDEDAGNYFISLIKKSRNDRFRLIDNMIHNWKH